MRLAPETLAAGRVRWQMFVTLTWSGRVPRPENRERFLRLYLRRLARRARVLFPELVWFAREEQGELGGRPHFHLLIAGFPSSALSFDFGVTVGQLWDWGWCEGRLWIPGLGAVEYSGEDGANCYESSKYGASLRLMLSESLARVVDRATGDNVDRRDAKHSENPEVMVWRDNSTGYDQQQLSLTPLATEGRGYLVAANVSKDHVTLHHRADITGAL